MHFMQGIDGWINYLSLGTTRPSHNDPIDMGKASQSKMCDRLLLAEIAAATINYSQLLAPARKKNHKRTSCRSSCSCLRENTQPVIPLARARLVVGQRLRS